MSRRYDLYPHEVRMTEIEKEIKEMAEDNDNQDIWGYISARSDLKCAKKALAAKRKENNDDNLAGNISWVEIAQENFDKAEARLSGVYNLESKKHESLIKGSENWKKSRNHLQKMEEILNNNSTEVEEEKEFKPLKEEITERNAWYVFPLKMEDSQKPIITNLAIIAFISLLAGIILQLMLHNPTISIFGGITIGVTAYLILPEGETWGTHLHIELIIISSIAIISGIIIQIMFHNPTRSFWSGAIIGIAGYNILTQCSWLFLRNRNDWLKTIGNTLLFVYVFIYIPWQLISGKPNIETQLSLILEIAFFGGLLWLIALGDISIKIEITISILMLYLVIIWNPDIMAKNHEEIGLLYTQAGQNLQDKVTAGLPWLLNNFIELALETKAYAIGLVYLGIMRYHFRIDIMTGHNNHG